MTTTTKHKTAITTHVSTHELMCNVMGSEWQTYEWWYEVAYMGGWDWDTIPDDHDAPYLHVGACDPDDEDAEPVKVCLSVNDIIASVQHMLSDKPWFAWDDWDADKADCVFQHAIYGDVIFG